MTVELDYDNRLSLQEFRVNVPSESIKATRLAVVDQSGNPIGFLTKLPLPAGSPVSLLDMHCRLHNAV